MDRCSHQFRSNLPDKSPAVSYLKRHLTKTSRISSQSTMLTPAAIFFSLPFVTANPVPAYSSSDLNIATPVGPASQTSIFPTVKSTTSVTSSITLPGVSLTPKPTITGVPRSTSSIVSTFTPITSTVYTGPICELLPYGPPDPFFVSSYIQTRMGFHIDVVIGDGCGSDRLETQLQW